MKLSIYRLPDDSGPCSYDVAAASACLQGLVNRVEGPRAYLTVCTLGKFVFRYNCSKAVCCSSVNGGT